MNQDNWEGKQASQQWATARLATSPRHSEWVAISKGNRTLKAFVIYPEVKRSVPVVMVIHEVFGLTDSTRYTADEIAAMGYIAVVPDMLSSRGPNGGDSRSFANSRSTSETLTSLADDEVIAEIDSFADYGLQLPLANGKLALVGLSWGGGAAFLYAGSGRADLKAVFVFYDIGPASKWITRINVPVYGFYGSNDLRVKGTLETTKTAMASAFKTYHPLVFDGADHAFMRLGEDPQDTNPANAGAAQASLASLKRALDNL